MGPALCGGRRELCALGGWCGPRGLAVGSGSWRWGEQCSGVRRANLREADGEDFVSQGVFWGSKQFIEMTYFLPLNEKRHDKC